MDVPTTSGGTGSRRASSRETESRFVMPAPDLPSLSRMLPLSEKTESERQAPACGHGEGGVKAMASHLAFLSVPTSFVTLGAVSRLPRGPLLIHTRVLPLLGVSQA